MEGLILAWTGLLGAGLGSFTNVVAWRLPRQESVVFRQPLPKIRPCHPLA
ncbi:putative type 4 prepilin peptidase [Synechococcus sp. WH 8109]|nr:prepilin peptidase [Synechococcus sp. WH 8109]AHF63198.1 putative type 4 prepilin peptidase [Synechococcus sp. WH 8109]